MMVNLTPHEINVMIDGEIVSFPPSGKVARVLTSETECGTVEINGVCIPTIRRSFGGVDNLAELFAAARENGAIVSAMVLDAMQKNGYDTTGVYAPDTGENSVIRNDKGHIVAVRRLIQE